MFDWKRGKTPLGDPVFNDVLEQVYSSGENRKDAAKWIESHCIASARFSQTVMGSTVATFVDRIIRSTNDLSWGMAKVGKSRTWAVVVVRDPQVFQNRLLEEFPMITVRAVMGS